MSIKQRKDIMPNMWMVRAGENAYLIDVFKELNVVAIGWELGDLSGKSPDEIKQIMKDTYPDASSTSLGNNTAQVIKFVCDFEIGDYVISYNPFTRKYLVGIITSDYYYTDKLADSVILNKYGDFYHNIRNVKWIGETNRDDLKDVASKPLKAIMTIFYLYDGAKNEILSKMNYDKIEWTDFYMEFGEKLLEYKNNRRELINKIQNVFNDLGMNLPTLEGDSEGNAIIPFDIDPFTIFALFNKQISAENRINILTQIKKEFSLDNEVPYTFHGVALVNNLKATFYRFSDSRGEEDMDNLWELYEIAFNYSNDKKHDFINAYDTVLTQSGIRWNITMGLNWIKQSIFINLDQNNRDILSSDEIFSEEFKEEIKSLKMPPNGEDYLRICEEIKSIIVSLYDIFID